MRITLLTLLLATISCSQSSINTELKSVLQFEILNEEFDIKELGKSMMHIPVQERQAIIEKNYGKKVVGMYLVCLHPDNKNKNYQVFKVSDLSEEVQDLFKLRLQMLEDESERANVEK